MKRIATVTLFMTLLFIAQRGYSQFFIVGGVGLDAYAGARTSVSTNTVSFGGAGASATLSSKMRSSSLGLLFTGGVGYRINSMFAVGGTLGYYMDMYKNVGPYDPIKPDDDYDIDVTTYHMGHIQPFFRVTPIRASKLSFFADVEIPLLFGSGVTKEIEVDKGVQKQTIIGNPSSRFMMTIAIVPGMEYHLNDHLSLFASLRFLQIGYTFQKDTTIYTTAKLGAATSTTTSTKHSFEFGTLAHKGIGIGVIYLF